MFLMLSSRCICKFHGLSNMVKNMMLIGCSIVGALARSQAPAFSTALMFAQEYGILAVSEEDRPFMPVTTIILEGVPRDMKAVFRHWNDALIPTAELMSGSLKRGKSLRIVGLEKAIQATRRG
jgi:hypothetical protein